MNPIIIKPDQINEQHRLAVSHRDKAVEHAIECGRLLRQVKDKLGRGPFGRWIEINCDFARSTATRYMAAADQSATGVAISSLTALFPSGRAERKPAAITVEKAERQVPAPPSSPPRTPGAAGEARNLPADDKPPTHVASDSAASEPEIPAGEDGAPDAEEIAAAEAGFRADQEAMAKLLEADDKLAWAMGEVKRLGALLRITERSRDGLMNGKATLEHLLKAEQRKVERLGEKLDIANATIARKDQEIEQLREENDRLRERVAIMEEAA